MLDERTEYKLCVLVDDQVVFKSSYKDSSGLEEELYKAEQAERKALDGDPDLLDDDEEEDL